MSVSLTSSPILFPGTTTYSAFNWVFVNFVKLAFCLLTGFKWVFVSFVKFTSCLVFDIEWAEMFVVLVGKFHAHILVVFGWSREACRERCIGILKLESFWTFRSLLIW